MRLRLSRLLISGTWGCYAFLLLSFLLLPIVIIVPVSFSASELLTFPPKSYSLRWYREVVENGAWWSSAANSLRIAVVASMLATAVGFFVGIAHYRFGRLGIALRSFLLSSMLIPHVVLATGLFELFLTTRQLGYWLTLAFAHASIAIPIATVLFTNAFDDLDRNLWIAAETLGAKFWFTLRKVILPVIWISVVASLIVSFQLSWDEVTYAVFFGPSTVPTVPMRMFGELAQGTNPSVTAVATILLTLTVIFFVVLALISKTRRRVRSPEAKTI